MERERPIEHSSIYPWSFVDSQKPDLRDHDYFPPDYPVNDELVTPAKTENLKQQHTA